MFPPPSYGLEYDALAQKLLPSACVVCGNVADMTHACLVCSHTPCRSYLMNVMIFINIAHVSINYIAEVACYRLEMPNNKAKWMQGS